MDGGTGIATQLHRFSVGDYHCMGEAGLLDGMRVEFVRGAVIDMAPIGTPHVLTTMQLTELLAPLLVSKRARLSVQGSIRLGDHSEPEPDLVLMSYDSDRTIHPAPPDILLVIEVADGSLVYDRAEKAPLYAEAGIPEYWIVDLVERAIEVHRDPGPSGYAQAARAISGELAPVALPGFEIAVADIFPPAA